MLLKINPIDSCLAAFVVKNGLLMNTFVAISKPTKLPLCVADVPLFISPQSCLMCFLICPWCYCLLLIFPNIGRELCLNVLPVKHPPCFSLLQTEGGLITVFQSFVTALTSLVITSTLITVRSPFPLI